MKNLVYMTKNFTLFHFLWVFAGITTGSSFSLLDSVNVNVFLGNLVFGLIFNLIPAVVFTAWISYRQKKAKATVPFLFIIPVVAGIAISTLNQVPFLLIKVFSKESPVPVVIGTSLFWLGVIVLADVSFWGCSRLPQPPAEGDSSTKGETGLGTPEK